MAARWAAGSPLVNVLVLCGGSAAILVLITALLFQSTTVTSLRSQVTALHSQVTGLCGYLIGEAALAQQHPALAPLAPLALRTAHREGCRR